MRTLIVRTDNIGDVVLSMPMAYILKQVHPEAEILFLAKDYVASVVKQHSSVDRFISYDHLISLPEHNAIHYLRDLKIDMIFHITPNKTLAYYAKKAGITHRVGTNRRYYHWLYCNRHVKLKRAKSNLHEAQLNLQLLKAVGLPSIYSLSDLIKPVQLKKPKLKAKIKSFLLDPPLVLGDDITDKKFTLLLHPGSNGNSKEWPVEYFIALAKWSLANNIKVFITGTEQERQRFEKPLLSHLPDAIDLMGKLSLNELIQLLDAVDGVVVCSTGPLHIAAALGKRCIGLFSAQPLKSSMRWGPIGEQAQVLSAKSNKINQVDEMASIQVSDVSEIITQWLSK